MSSIIPVKPFGKDLKDILRQDNDSSDVVSASGFPLQDPVGVSVSPVPVVSGGVSGGVRPGDSFVRGGITFSRSSEKGVSVLDAVLFAKDRGMVLQSVDQAVYARVMLDKDPLVGVDGVKDLDSSQNYQMTSSFASYGVGLDGRVWVGVWDLESVFGGDLDKHVAVVTQLSDQPVRERVDPLMQGILKYVNDAKRIMNPDNIPSPRIVPIGMFRTNPVANIFLPQSVVRYAGYLERKGCKSGRIHVRNSSDFTHLKGQNLLETRVVQFGQVVSGVYDATIGDGLISCSKGCARGVSPEKKHYGIRLP